MDAAYTTEFATNVMVPTLRRSYLFINPTTRKPVYEYRGGIYITPGCDIDSFTASLACVTSADKTKYPNDIICSGTSDCACYSLAGTGPSINTPITSTGKMTQTVPVDRAFHYVADNSAYVFDHLRIELVFSDPEKKKSCLPDSNSDGVFYFPIADRTPFNLIGCEVVPSAGTLLCTSGVATALGFGNLIISGIVNRHLK